MKTGETKSDYGMDGPEVIRTMFAVSAGAAVGAWLLPSLRVRGRGIPFAGLVRAVLSLVGVASGALGTAMTAYGLRGKFNIRDLMLDQIAWRGDETVLDVGTGLGLLSIGAAKRLTTGKAVGVDIWRAVDLTGNTREATRRNIALEGVTDKVELVEGDARALPFADNSFDVVLSLLCIHNIEDATERAKACAEIARVLKPGGVALVGDYTNTADYVQEFDKAGLQVNGRKAYHQVAYGLMWVVTATK